MMRENPQGLRWGEGGGGERGREVSVMVKGRFCFISSVRPGRAKLQSELIVAHLGKSSLVLATHGRQMCWTGGREEKGGM